MITPLPIGKSVRIRVPYTVRRNQSLRVTTDTRQIEENADVFKRLGELVQEAWS